MKASELRDMSNADLEKLINDNKQELFTMRFQKSVGKLTNTARVRLLKKDIARAKTVIHERTLVAEGN
ncbi:MULTISPECIES: 50S ribosomal protein L29 [Herpetosiphon]|jgi:large subunit ribosomal protein L29|uniref:Large ribosomal subunit protein uL29 n=1 Tax=Herpetosiphon gulosus TaxID=1973496 RepID=A0ABP9WVE3_9CHLR|nr:MULTISPECIES: 50S ribosomal protein L29 [Herpetosiphon]MCA0353136.1 50S ribosomal protein L29 [Chloroflexota bacterium]HBW49673.1 50S ribosomal protein L29 [Herpetosiphon sp.]